jgi:hypothetical protein
MISSSFGGITGFSTEGGMGSWFRMPLKVWAEVLPGKGSDPVAIS